MMALCGGHTDSHQRHGMLHPTCVEGLWAFGPGKQKMLLMYGDMAMQMDRERAEVGRLWAVFSAMLETRCGHNSNTAVLLLLPLRSWDTPECLKHLSTELPFLAVLLLQWCC